MDASFKTKRKTVNMSTQLCWIRPYHSPHCNAALVSVSIPPEYIVRYPSGKPPRYRQPLPSPLVRGNPGTVRPAKRRGMVGEPTELRAMLRLFPT